MLLTCALVSGLTGCFEQPSRVEPEGFTERARAKLAPATQTPPVDLSLPPLSGPPGPLPSPTTGGATSPDTVAAVSLALTPTEVSVSDEGTIDLSYAVQALATLTTGATLDVSRDVTHDRPVGGTLSGNIFRPTRGVTTASARVVYSQAGREPLVQPLPISVLPAAARPVALSISPTFANLPVGTAYGLRDNLHASVRFSDATTVDASSSVSFIEPVNCRLEDGGVLVTSQTTGTGSVTVVFSNAAGSITSRFGLTVLPARPKVTSLTLTPTSTSLPAGATLDLRTLVRARATFETGPAEDVEADLSYGPAPSGRLTGAVFTAPAVAGSIPVPATYSSGGASITRTFTVNIPASTVVYPLLLFATPTGASIAGPIDLRTIIMASAWYSDNTARNVIGEVGFAALSGGTVSDVAFYPSGGATRGSVLLTLSNPRGSPLTAAASFDIAVPVLPRLASLAATPVLTVAAGSRLALRTAVSVEASFADAPTRDVSREVVYGAVSGGTLEGEIFVAAGPAAPGVTPVTSGALDLTYSSGTVTVTTSVRIDIVGAALGSPSLTITPTSLRMEAGEELSLRSAVQAVVSYGSGAPQDLSGRASFLDPRGGSLDGTVFRAGNRGLGSVTIRVESAGVTLSRTLTIDILDTVDGTPTSLALSPAQVSLEPGGTLDLFATVQALAALANGSTVDVSGHVSYAATAAGASVAGGRLLRVDGRTSSGTVVASYTARGRTVRATLAFICGRSRRVPIALATEPARLGVVAGARLDLALAASCLATFQDGSREEVTRDVSYSNPVGGRLEGRIFIAEAGFSSGSVLVSYTAEGITRRATLALTIHREKAGLISLGLSPSTVRLAAGSRYGLALNVRVSAGYDDGTTGTVSNGVDWRAVRGGRVVDTALGPVFEPEIGSGVAATMARYTSGGATRSATLAVEVVPAIPSGVGLIVTPPRVALIPGASLLLPENVSIELRRQDGTRETVTRATRWVSPVGGTLSQAALGTVFTAGPLQAAGSVTAVVQDGDQTFVAVLPVEVTASAGTAKHLPEAAVGVPYRAELSGFLGSGFEAQPRTLGQPLAGTGLVFAGGAIAGTPTTAALLALEVTAGSSAPAVFDTLFLEIRKSVVLAEPKRMERAAVPTSLRCEGETADGARSCIGADLDGDGLDDRILLEGPDGRETVQVRLATGNGRYLTGRTVASAPGALALEAADVDGDSRTDVVLLRPEGGLWLRNLTPR